MKTAVLEKMKNCSNPIKVANDVMNKHILITGKSGSGKTTAIQQIERELVKQEACVLVLNYNNTHSQMERNKEVCFINARREGIPLNLLTPLINSHGIKEELSDITESILEIFNQVDPLGIRQRGALRTAISCAVENREKYSDHIQAIYECLRSDNSMQAKAVLDRFWSLFSKFKICDHYKLFESEKLVILDLSKFNSLTQKVIAEMILSILWRYFQAGNQAPLYIVCDEFQVLNLREDSTLNKILREERRFNLFLLLATQPLSTFNKGTKVILQQVGTRLYFRPAENDIKEIVSCISNSNKNEIKEILLNLNIGEYLADGRFLINGNTVERVLKMSFYL